MSTTRMSFLFHLLYVDFLVHELNKRYSEISYAACVYSAVKHGGKVVFVESLNEIANLGLIDTTEPH